MQKKPVWLFCLLLFILMLTVILILLPRTLMRQDRAVMSVESDVSPEVFTPAPSEQAPDEIPVIPDTVIIQEPVSHLIYKAGKLLQSG